MTRPPGRPRAVFDCNTLVQAVAFDQGPAAECLRLAQSGRIELFVSRSTLAELRRVLAYPEIRQMSPNITAQRIDAFFQRLMFRATLLRRVGHLFDYPRDPGDEPYLDLAAAAGADYLVTRDRDLLDLMSGHSDLCRRFRRKTRPLRIVDPPTFLREMASAEK